jgi:flagellar motility protein MotE (MotC chaperone)
MIMKNEQRSGLLGGALERFPKGVTRLSDKKRDQQRVWSFSDSVEAGKALGAGTALATILVVAAALPAQAQGWKAETTQSIAKPAPSQQQRKPQRAGAKKPAKSQERLVAAPVDTPRRTYAPVEEAHPIPETGEPAATAAVAAPRPAPATPGAPAPETSAAKPVAPSVQSGPMPAATMTDSDAPEPDDPFVDVHIVERAARNDVAITAAAETNRPGVEVGPTSQTPAGQYCTNIADAAIDARIAWQRQNLAEAEKQIQQKATELEAKTAEFQRWLQRRDEFVEKAKKTIVDIYTKMRPDAAALQLQSLDEETAAAVLVKLDARTASAVMNEMDPMQAARLTSIISGASKLPRPRPAPPAGRS